MVMAIMMVSVTVSAQVVSKDSISSLNQQKDALKISKRLNDNKLKLAKLQNEVPGKTADVQRTAEQAQKSAIENQTAANNLASSPQDKALARRADNAGSQAKKDARRARSAADDLQSLNKDIENLQKKIADDQQKLGIQPTGTY